MKPILVTVIMLLALQNSFGQQTVELSPTTVNTSHQIFIANMNGWLFKEGNNADWSKRDIDLTGWTKFKPTDLSVQNADQSGKVEGWFRIKIKLDSALKNIPLSIMFGGFAATDLYLNGRFIQSFGVTGMDGLSYKEHRPYQQLPVRLPLETDKDNTLAIHFVDRATWFTVPKHLKSEWGVFDRAENLERIVSLTLPQYDTYSLRNGFHNDKYSVILSTIIAMLCFLFWLLFYLNAAEKNLLLIAITCTLFIGFTCCGTYFNTFKYSETAQELLVSFWRLFLWPAIGILPVLLSQLLLGKILRSLLGYFILTMLLGIICFFSAYSYVGFETIGLFALVTILLNIVIVVKSFKKIRGAQWSIVVGLLVSVVSGTLWLFSIGDETNVTNNICNIAFPVSLLVYVAIRFKEMLRDVRENARQIIQVTEEKRKLLASENERLEQQVVERTADLTQSLQHLKSTQAQLIQSEKMASLGELTTGIAHEIQNPLNFINNFSDVNKELLEELKEEMDKGRYDDVKEIARDVIDNEEKINHHGRRADAIVKAMLQHSRTSRGEKEPTNIGRLADEYLRLAYHGFKERNRSFEALIESDFDNSIEQINVVPQDIGRVFLNLINNAFYAVNERRKQNLNGYEPSVSVSTTKQDQSVQIKIMDNGVGIPQSILEKIFQPFFTTKPTGQGTGLGLSLAYDIIKAHGGEIKVETKEGAGSTFIIQLPG